jgi:hypothetical protein
MPETVTLLCAAAEVAQVLAAHSAIRVIRFMRLVSGLWW